MNSFVDRRKGANNRGKGGGGGRVWDPGSGLRLWGGREKRRGEYDKREQKEEKRRNNEHLVTFLPKRTRGVSSNHHRTPTSAPQARFLVGCSSPLTRLAKRARLTHGAPRSWLQALFFSSIPGRRKTRDVLLRLGIAYNGMRRYIYGGPFK